MSYRGRYWMVYNGEIYNYRELREELIALGHTFESNSDSEVALAAYSEWGVDCLSRFNGMWSIVILDTETGRLFLARDRFGVKPLYYWQTGARLAFASEIKSFSVFGDWAPVANVPRVLDFLIWSVTDHTAETMFRDVFQLRGGHYATLDVSRLIAGAADASIGNLEIVRWYVPEPRDEISGRAAEEALRAALEDSVRLRLRADVPVGSCLSGGLDSSAIVAVMSDQLHASTPTAQVNTFSARSTDKEFDEGEYAQLVVTSARTSKHETTPTAARLFEEVSALVWHQDEPFASTSIFAQWCVFALAREQGVTVMLDGQGADEILGGYRGFFGAHLAGLLRAGRLAAWAREVEALRTVVGFSYARSIGYTIAYAFPALKFVLGRLDGRAYGDLTWINPALRTTARTDPHAELGSNTSSVRAMSTALLSATNLPMLLRWEDRNSMAFSVEARLPFLDYRLVETTLGINDADKVGKGVTKAVLRKAMKGTVPDPILDRRDKMGFVTAEAKWILGDCRDQYRSMLRQAIAAVPQILNDRLLDQFDEVIRGERTFDHRYWRAISLGQWVQAFGVAVN
ncbi:asparagine synthase (glutamine-hydrolyzing) [Rhodopseudomonas palustris]|nr:asparagine synthase (glutamine-hydrolyzing) [Rhodopseudomonas palustris]